MRRRIADLGLPHALYGVHDKLAAAEPLLASLGVAWTDTAAIGDDWPDLPLLRRAGRLMPQDMERVVRAAVQPLQRARARVRVHGV